MAMAKDGGRCASCGRETVTERSGYYMPGQPLCIFCDLWGDAAINGYDAQPIPEEGLADNDCRGRFRWAHGILTRKGFTPNEANSLLTELFCAVVFSMPKEDNPR